MIYCKELNTSFPTQKEMLDQLRINKENLYALKKSAVKFTDSFDCLLTENDTEKGIINKANTPIKDSGLTEILVKIVINTTNIIDSHRDMHVNGIWKRSLDHNDIGLHLQEHKREFDKVISSDAKFYTRQLAWKTLGADFEGTTQALIAESLVKQSRNPLMFEQYKNGWVTNHSVGMEYVTIQMCVNSEERWWTEEKEAWDKYYPMAVNKEDADSYGYFWAVTEAKRKEGSAVLMGSNYVTPTLDNNLKHEQSPSTDSADATQKNFENFYNKLKLN